MGTVYYDGTCKLCHGVISFLLKRKSDNLRYLELQSEDGKHAQSRISSKDSIIYEESGVYYQESAAVIQVLKKMSWPYRILAKIIKTLPSRWVDSIYRYIAARRYRWFGRRDHCDLQT